ncbi:MAG: hypothetical protein HWD61_01070 [Parachlamydiaceae bacterium]|nr:MAG: hypothetical protein HWD61_01070 [Parachlamydiaceae bacterium]
MKSIFLPSSLEANKKYPSIQLISQENAKTKPYEGKEYRLYGKVDLETDLVTKITKLFQFIAAALLVPATCGILLGFKTFRDLLNRKFQAISKTSIDIYVLNQLKQSTGASDQMMPRILASENLKIDDPLQNQSEITTKEVESVKQPIQNVINQLELINNDRVEDQNEPANDEAQFIDINQSELLNNDGVEDQNEPANDEAQFIDDLISSMNLTSLKAQEVKN